MTFREGGAAAAAPLAAALRRFRGRYGHFLEWVVSGLMIVLFVEVTAGVVFRALGQSLIWYDEVASALLAWLTYYGSALASVKRAHIGCPELVEALPWRARRGIGILAQLVVIAFFVILGTVGLSNMPMLSGDSMVSLPWIPMNVVQSVIPISAALIVIAELTHLVDLLIAAGPPAAGGDALPADGLH